MPRQNDPLVVGRVVGDVLNPFTKSVDLLEVYYNSIKVGNGREFKPSHVVKRPNVIVGGDDLRTFYTLVSQGSSSTHRESIPLCSYLLYLLAAHGGS